jgi:hypothetical protein
MATLSTLLERKALIRVTVPLGRRQFHDRKFYAFPKCLEWMRNDVPRMVTGRIASASTPKEQLIERLRQWMAAEPMAYERMFRDMDPRSDNVWEIKTADLRIFGWLYRPRVFIAVSGGYADDYKEPTKIKNYADDRRGVVRARADLDLDLPKYVGGDFDELV